MKAKIEFLRLVFGFCGITAALLVTGCTRINLINHALVKDLLIVPVSNDPYTTTSFTLLEVDGRKVVRAPLPEIYGHPRAWISPGTHTFKVSAKPLGKEHGEVTFTATVLSGKKYVIYSQEGQPALIEEDYYIKRKESLRPKA